jgi:hypothetical protein
VVAPPTARPTITGFERGQDQRRFSADHHGRAQLDDPHRLARQEQDTSESDFETDRCRADFEDCG